jgi:hypothetical protein
LNRLQSALPSLAALCALLITFSLYVTTTRKGADSGEDTEQALALIGRRLIGKDIRPVLDTTTGPRGVLAVAHLTQGLVLAESARLLTDTSSRYIPLQRQALAQYDSALGDPVHLGQENILRAQSHRWWARNALGEPNRHRNRLDIPWYVWILFAAGAIASLMGFLLSLLRLSAKPMGVISNERTAPEAGLPTCAPEAGTGERQLPES